MPFTTMSLTDHDAVCTMIKEGALEPIRPTDFPKGGYIKIACPDGDTTPELLQHLHYTVCPQANDGERMCTHSVLIAGGPGAIPKESPMHAISYKGRHVCGADGFVFSQIEIALRAKGDRVRNIALGPHCACAAATMNNLSAWNNFHLAFLAKDCLKKEFPNQFESIRVMPHINFSGYPKEDFRTYVLRRDPFLRSFEKHVRRKEKVAA